MDNLEEYLHIQKKANELPEQYRDEFADLYCRNLDWQEAASKSKKNELLVSLFLGGALMGMAYFSQYISNRLDESVMKLTREKEVLEEVSMFSYLGGALSFLCAAGSYSYYKVASSLKNKTLDNQIEQMKKGTYVKGK